MGWRGANPRLGCMRRGSGKAGLGVIAGAGIGSLGLTASTPERHEVALEAEPAAAMRPSQTYEVLPDERPVSAQTVLERRLAALAAAVEAGRAGGAGTGLLVEFDVEGLAATIDAEL